MNIFTDIHALTLNTLGEMIAAGELPTGLSLDNVAVEPPRDASHGDMATNAAMVLAKPAGMKPRDIAEALAKRLVEDDRIATADVAGPGFLNLRLEDEVWQGLVKTTVALGPAFGRSNLGEGVRVNVEYVSANPTGGARAFRHLPQDFGIS